MVRIFRVREDAMLKKIVPALAVAVLALSAVLAACGDGTSAAPTTSSAAPAAQDGNYPLPGDPKNWAPLEKYEAMKVPADNPITQDKVNLGWKLWFDKRLSGKGERSCYDCHVNEKGLTDGLPKNTNANDGKPLARHTPTLWNIGYHAEYYWDGRAKSLEGQALAAWKLANMGAKDPAEDKVRADVIERINKAYAADFKKVFGAPADEKNVVQALATFMRTIVSKNTAWDKFLAGDTKAMSESAQRGWEIFQKVKCTNCHVGALLTNQQFHNVGVGMKAEKPDVGRFAVTKIEKDTGAFKTPTLRDVSRSAPYFHDGSVATLEEAVKQMLAGGIDNPFLDRVNLQKQEVDEQGVKDIVEFLKALDEPFRIPTPKLP
jgi:cytochrome c peroxidase